MPHAHGAFTEYPPGWPESVVEGIRLTEGESEKEGERGGKERERE